MTTPPIRSGLDLFDETDTFPGIPRPEVFALAMHAHGHHRTATFFPSYTPYASPRGPRRAHGAAAGMGGGEGERAGAGRQGGERG